MAIKKEELTEEYRDILNRLTMEVDTSIKIKNVILSEENKYKLKSFLKEVQYRDKLKLYNLDYMNKLLFYGASGTGKTMLAKAISNHLGYTMLYIDIAKSLTDGDVAKNISDIFKLANHMGNCIIFLDECDSIAWNRDATNAENGVIRRATNSIFQYLDQMDHSNIFISATNMLHRLDAAFERRFHMKFEFRRPSLNIDECINKFIYPKFLIDDNVDETVREIANRRIKQNAKLSYYELEELVKRAMKRSVLNDTNIIRTADIYDDLIKAMNFKIRVGTNTDENEIKN